MLKRLPDRYFQAVIMASSYLVCFVRLFCIFQMMDYSRRLHEKSLVDSAYGCSVFSFQSYGWITG
jgi:hypothetical protein